MGTFTQSNYPVALLGQVILGGGGVGGGGTPDPFQGLAHTLYGWDGTEIDLSDPGNGLFLLSEEQLGMESPAHAIYSAQSPALAGSLHRGVRTLDRNVGWVLFVFDDDSTEGFLERNRNFWRIAGNPTRVNRWRVTAPDGSWRELKVRFVEDASGGYQRDAVLDGWSAYQLRLVAQEPFWYGQTVPKTFSTGEAQDFFTGQVDPPLFISTSATLDGGVLNNEGSDIDAWAKWTFNGPLTGLDLTTTNSEGENPQTSLIGTLGLPDVPDGEVLVVDTHPRVSTALLDGVDVSGQVDPWDPRPVPAGGTQTISVAFGGTGSVTVEFAPEYRRAF